MKKIVLAVALLLLAVTATNAAPAARQGRPKPPVKTQGTTKGQAAQKGRLPNQAAAPLRLDAAGGGTVNPGVNPTGAAPGQTGNGGIPAAPGQPGVGGVAVLPPVSGQQPIAIIQGAPVFAPSPGGAFAGLAGAAGKGGPPAQPPASPPTSGAAAGAGAQQKLK